MSLTKVTNSMIAGAVINVDDYGALGNGSDDSAAINAALAACPAGGTVVGSNGKTYTISQQVTITSCTLTNIVFSFGANNGYLVLTGTNPALKNCTITTNEYTHVSSGGSLWGAINLHLTTGAVLDNVTITDGKLTDSVGVFCATKASNTRIVNCNFGYSGFGIWFNDSNGSPPYSNIRTVGGTTYTGTIGQGLTIQNCAMGAADKTANGDAIEINTPVNRFTDVQIIGNTCYATKNETAGPANGIGFSCAEVDGVVMANNYVSNVAAGAGALHIENCTAASLTGNVLKDNFVAIGAGNRGTNTSIIGNTFTNNGQDINASGNVVAPFNGLMISGNNFYLSNGYSITLTDVINVQLSNNIWRNVTAAAAGHQLIQVIQSAQTSVDFVIIKDNIFTEDNSQNFIILTTTGTVANMFSSGNIFCNLSISQMQDYIKLIQVHGLTQDFLPINGAVNGMAITVNYNPNGYFTPSGTSNVFATDANAAVLYKWNGTAWSVKVS